MTYLTTGQAAKLLLVTRDTVLKWVKQGKLSAIRTEGGHYRISLEHLKSSTMICADTSSPGKVVPERNEAVPYCWEYFGPKGEVKDSCRSCLVFKVKGTRCYELADFLLKTGFGATCCPTSCDLCPYFIENAKHSLKVLIFTEEQSFRELMSKQFQFSSVDFRFACWDYECSFIIESFRPQYVIVDGNAGQEKHERLRWHLSNDPRIPGVKVVIAGSLAETAEPDTGVRFSQNTNIQNSSSEHVTNS
jgi:excisionase family DNA binding protein